MNTQLIANDGFGILTIRCTGEFYVFINDKLVAPNSSTDRIAKLGISATDVIAVVTEGTLSYEHKALPLPYETPDPDSMCEVLESNELSMFERMRAEITRQVNAYAESRALDTYNEDDLDFDDDDPLIDTPYEYQAMLDEITPVNAPTEAPTLSEQPQPPRVESNLLDADSTP